VAYGFLRCLEAVGPVKLIQPSPATRFLARLEAAGVPYAQFKSTSRLAESFAGATDFDLLLRSSDLDEVLKIALTVGFVRRETPSTPAFWHCSVVDLLVLDEGRSLFHISLHTTVPLGPSKVKTHALPPGSVDLLLNRAVPHEDFPVFVLRPVDELIVLLLRLAFRVEIPRVAVRAALRRVNAAIPELQMLNDLNRLLAMVSTEEMLSSGRLIAPRCERALVRFQYGHDAQSPRVLRVIRLRLSIASRTQPWRAVSRIEGLRRRAAAVRRRTVSGGRLRTVRPAGLLVAIVGPDGAGKSTLAASLEKLFSAKQTTAIHYLGLQKRHLVPRVLEMAGRACRRARWKSAGDYFSELTGLTQSFLRVRAVRSAFGARRQGLLVITDRFPFSEFWSASPAIDGPRLDPRALLGRVETWLYSQADTPPDVIIALDADLATLQQRKPDEANEIARLQQKIQALDQLASNRVSVFRIDANQSQEVVVKLSAARIWTELTRQ